MSGPALVSALVSLVMVAVVVAVQCWADREQQRSMSALDELAALRDALSGGRPLPPTQAEVIDALERECQVGPYAAI